MERKEKIETYRRLNRFVVGGQILFTGSSLMEQFPIGELRFWENIGPVIYNRAVGGFTTDDFLENMDVMLLDPKPSKVFINIGTNDIADRETRPGGWMAHLLENYEKILCTARMQLPACRVYVMAYYPSNMEVIRKNPQSLQAFGLRTLANIQKANREVEKLADSLGYRYIDVNEGLGDADGNLREEWTLDGVHMTPEAYARILKNMKPFLNER